MADVAHSHPHLHDWIVYAGKEGLFPLTGLYLVANTNVFNKTHPKEWTRIALAHDQMEPVSFELFEKIVIGSIGENDGGEYLREYAAIVDAPSPVDADVERIVTSGAEARPAQRYSEIEATLFVLKIARRWDAAHAEAPGGMIPDESQETFRQTWVGVLGRACATLLHACDLDIALKAVHRLNARVAIGPLATGEEAPSYHRAMFLAARRIAAQGYDPILVLMQSKLDGIEAPGGVFDEAGSQEIDDVTLVLNGVSDACATYPSRERALRGLRHEEDDFSGLPEVMAAAFARDLAFALDEALVDLLHAAKLHLTDSQIGFGQTLEAQQFEWEVNNAAGFVRDCLPAMATSVFDVTCQRLGLDRRPNVDMEAILMLPKFRGRQ